MKYFFIIAIAILLASCELEEFNEPSKQYERTDRHDLPPLAFKGDWASVSYKEEIIVTLTDSTITMNLDRYGYGTQTINFTNNRTVNVGDYLYTIEYNDVNIRLSTGSHPDYIDSVTLTIGNDCITHMKLYVPPVVTPTEPETPINNFN